jgi:NRPS condensation-like uncharacterized protein
MVQYRQALMYEVRPLHILQCRHKERATYTYALADIQTHGTLLRGI